MACRIGITTDLVARQEYWESKCECFKNWQVSGPFESREHAQQAETALANTHGCEAHYGGNEPDDPNAKWFLYFFEHCGCLT